MLPPQHKIQKQGFLFKQSLHLKKYRKRWMVLTDELLYSFKEKTSASLVDLKFTEVIDIRKCHDIKQEICGKCHSVGVAHKCIFVLSFINGTERRFHSKQSVDIKDWIQCIRDVIIKHNKLNITVNIFVDHRYPFNQSCNISKSYIDDKTLQNDVMQFVMKTMHKKHHPMQFQLVKIHTPCYKQVVSRYCFYYYRTNHIRDVYLKVKPIKIKNRGFNMLCNKTLNCEIYKDVKLNRNVGAKAQQKHLQHLIEYNHCKDVLTKPECKLNEKCDTYIRLENGGNQTRDLCHVKIFRHPPRSRQIKLAENFAAFVMNTDHKQNEPIYCPSKSDTKQWNKQDGYLKKLWREIIKNGFKNDLYLKNDNEKNKGYSIMYFIDKKLNSFKHKSLGLPLNKAEMLSLVMYTQCECNYDLCKSQRDGNYKKWHWFDFCLYNAIYKLSQLESAECKLFSGLCGVNFDVKNVNNGYFVTYVSSTWNKDVAMGFVGAEGMIIEIDQSIQSDKHFVCCDVSWISGFPHECEILIARSTGKLFYVDNVGYDKQYKTDNQFGAKIIDQSDTIQTVLLFQSKTYITAENQNDERDQQYDPCNENDSLKAIY